MANVQPIQPRKTNGLAIAGFVTSLLCCNIVAIVLSAVALNQFKTDPDQEGKGLAIAGLVIGIVSTIGWLIYLIFFVALAASNSGTY